MSVHLYRRSDLLTKIKTIEAVWAALALVPEPRKYGVRKKLVHRDACLGDSGQQHTSSWQSLGKCLLAL